MKEQVLDILSRHDALRSEDRKAFADYLRGVFDAAEKVAELEAHFKALRDSL